MAFRKNSKTENDVFCLTFPLICEPWQQDQLDKIFKVSNFIKNNLIQNRLNALKQLERTKRWRQLQSQLSETYNAMKSASEKQRKALCRQQNILFKERNALLQKCGFSKNAFEKIAKQYRYHYAVLAHSQVVQNISADVWKSFESYLYENGKVVHFSPASQFTCICGKSNSTGICYQDGIVSIGQEKSKMRIPVRLDSPKRDKYGYQQEALRRNIHYCKIIRTPVSDGWRYSLQLVLGGKPPVKVHPSTGELVHPFNSGRVGLDIGTQTLAAVGDRDVFLDELAPDANNLEKELRRINRAMDRSRRAMNPKMFDPITGEIIRKDRLPPECLTRRGTRNWIKSKRYLRLERERHALYAKQASRRRQQHNELANRLLEFGDEFYVEDMNFKALAKRSKEDRITKNGKHASKKRFGKSLANKAPALFLLILEQKTAKYGGSLTKINTWKAKASQYNHKDKAYKKKHLSQRWTKMPTGEQVQRDLYSAFLIQNIDSTLSGFLQDALTQKYENFLSLHNQEIHRLNFISRALPTSIGI